MFQYAALYSVANLRGKEFYVPEGEYDLLKCFPNLTCKYISNSSTKPKNVFNAKEGIDFTFDQNLFCAMDNTDINGYFQSELYFSHCADKIKKEFAFSNEVLDRSKAYIESVRSSNESKNICAVHFRRGDYIGLGHVHTNLDSSYYEPAINWMINNIENCTFVAFSDDPKWCKENLPLDIFNVSEDANMYEDMCRMSFCDTHIIANSSFSWWGAWLSDSKQVIAPKDWFGPRGPKKWDSIYCNGWGIA
jgi:hypothetical protein